MCLYTEWKSHTLQTDQLPTARAAQQLTLLYKQSPGHTKYSLIRIYFWMVPFHDKRFRWMFAKQAYTSQCTGHQS